MMKIIIIFFQNMRNFHDRAVTTKMIKIEDTHIFICAQSDTDTDME